ncbi:MAG: hypothetical protein HC803_03590 [Saprospiraceae bacterium]|nr:hypothetical protein [Saprospiraceae bacterium]
MAFIFTLLRNLNFWSTLLPANKTSDETLARAYDFVRSIGKIPIIIRDRRGFYTPRVSSMYAMEGLALLDEGVPPVVIERLGIKAGMAQGPLAMLDEMSLATTLIFERRKQEHFTNIYYHKKEIKVLEKMVNELSREGAISKAGFYDYSGETPKLWEGLKEHFEIDKTYPDEKEVIDRYMFVQTIEAVRTLEQGTIRSVEEANLGSIWGWNFPPFKGGVLQYINDYGLNNFIEQAKVLEAKYGVRFTLPKLIQEKAEQGETF